MIPVVDNNFRQSCGSLVLGGLPIEGIAARHGTPLFVYDAGVAQKKWDELRRTLPARFKIHYSIKANPNQRILRFFLQRGAGLEVASGGELYQALAAKADPDSILFAGPGKTNAEIELAIKSSIREIHVESFGELERVDDIANALGKVVRIGVRINPTDDVPGAAMRMGGRPSPFGVDESEVESFVRKACGMNNVELRGIHLFMGTQILDYTYLIAQYKNAVRLAKQITRLTNTPLATLDFGGGLGVPYFAHEQTLELAPLIPAIQEISAELENDPLLSDAQCVVEPGRFLTAECGVYVSKVTDIKLSRGKKFVLLDGGMHHHLAASGNLGQTIKRNYPIAVVNKLDAPCDETVELVGPLCTPLDVLGRSVSLPNIEIGDLVGVFQSGAYARTSSPHEFLSHPSPPEVWVERGKDDLIRRRGCYADNLNDQSVNIGGVSFPECQATAPMSIA